MIHPADDPQVAVFSGHGLRSESGATEPPGTIRILTDDPGGFAKGAREMTAPNGTRVEMAERNPPVIMPASLHSFVVWRLADQAPCVLEASDHVEVIEVSVPAEYVTGIDHDTTLPTAHLRPQREWQGPKFVYNRGQGDPVCARHDTDILFTFVMEERVTLHGEGRDPYDLTAGDAFVIPPGMKTRMADPSDDIELLEVALRGLFKTELETE